MLVLFPQLIYFYNNILNKLVTMNTLFFEHNITQIFNKAKENDIETKQYKCPCGKAYFSYPAIFTHIRNKHGGKAPGEIIKPSASSIKTKSKGLKDMKEQIGLPRKEDESTSFSLKQEMAHIDFIYFLVKIGSDLPLNIGIKKNKLPLNIVYETDLKQRSDDRNSNPNCLNVLAKFIKELEIKIGNQNGIIQGLIVLLSLFCKNVDRTFSPFKTMMTSYTQMFPPSDLVFFANNFMTNYIQEQLFKYKLNTYEFFKVENITKILQYLFNWLYKNGYSQQYLVIKKQETNAITQSQ